MRKSVNLKSMTPAERRAYYAAAQRRYHQRLRDQGIVTTTRSQKDAARMAMAKRAWELKRQCPELTIRTLAKRLGVSDTALGVAMRMYKETQ